MNTKIFVNGKTYNVELYRTENGIATIAVWDTWSYFVHNLKLYYRSERTLDDHMGNTPCGYYVNLPLPFCNKTQRFYIYR